MEKDGWAKRHMYRTLVLTFIFHPLFSIYERISTLDFGILPPHVLEIAAVYEHTWSVETFLTAYLKFNRV